MSTNFFRIAAVAVLGATFYQGYYRRRRELLAGIQLMPWYLSVAYVVMLVAMLLVFLYGVVFFTDAPIRACGKVFCGKTGITHTESEYRQFNVWQNTLIITWIIGFPLVCGFSAAAKNISKQKDRKSRFDLRS